MNLIYRIDDQSLTAEAFLNLAQPSRVRTAEVKAEQWAVGGEQRG